jgi:hypothetical protein
MCDFHASTSSKLRRHERSHASNRGAQVVAKPFACCQCSFRAAKASALEAHVARRHITPVEGDPEAPTPTPGAGTVTQAAAATGTAAPAVTVMPPSAAARVPAPTAAVPAAATVAADAASVGAGVAPLSRAAAVAVVDGATMTLPPRPSADDAAAAAARRVARSPLPQAPLACARVHFITVPLAAPMPAAAPTAVAPARYTAASAPARAAPRSSVFQGFVCETAAAM